MLATSSLWLALSWVAVAQDAVPDVRTEQVTSETLSDLPWYLGMPVGLVSLEAADGGLPPEYLEPLLRVRVGQRLTAGDLREDVGLLFRAASFAAVEAEVEPWVASGADGEMVDGVRVVYRVVPAATVARVSIEGPTGPARRLASRSLGVHRDEAIFAADDIPRLVARVQGALADAGWVDARVVIDAEETGPRRVDLTVRVEPGEPRRYGELRVVGDIVGPTTASCRWTELRARVRRDVLRRPECGMPPARVKRWLRREGVVEGRRVETDQLEDALVEVRRKLVARGWLQARMGFHVGQPAPGDEHASRTINVEGGPRLVLAVDHGRSFRERVLPAAGKLQDTLGYYGGERIDDVAAEEGEQSLRQWLDARGFVASEVELTPETIEDGVKLHIVVDPGRRHRLRGIEVDGADALGEPMVAGAMKEAALETLGENRVSMGGIETGLSAVEDVYRGAGHLSAEARFVDLSTRRAFEPWLFRRWRPVRATVKVAIAEGPRTDLQTLEVRDPGGRTSDLVATARADLEGQPLNLARLELLERELVARYQSLGFLRADSQLEVVRDEEANTAQATLTVTPGSQVRLRSVVVRGNRRVRRKVITRELELEVGEPITPQAINSSRSALYDLGLFRVVSPELVGDDDRTRDLIVQVDERKNILLEGGGRVATDQGVLATARATHRNLGGLGHNLSLTGQLGYNWLADEWVVDTQAPVWRMAVRYTAPWVPGEGHELVVEGLLREVAQEPTFRIERSGARVGIRSKLSDKVETFVDYNAQVRQLQSFEYGALVPGDPWLPAVGLDADAVGDAVVPSENRLQAGPEVLLLFDGRDDRFNPTRGTFISGQAQLSDGLWSDYVAVRGDLRVEQFVGAGPLVLDLFGRVAGGRAAGAGNTLPIEDRYYLGGAGSMRGFRLNTVGPANFAARPNLQMPGAVEPALEGRGLRSTPGQWVWTGGDSLWQTTVEVRMPLTVLGLEGWDSTNLFAFTDVGQVSFVDAASRTDSARAGLDRPYRYGVGGGVRVATPIGPAAVAIGFNPDPVSAWDEPTIQPHITLGEL